MKERERKQNNSADTQSYAQRHKTEIKTNNAQITRCNLLKISVHQVTHKSLAKRIPVKNKMAFSGEWIEPFGKQFTLCSLNN